MSATATTETVNRYGFPLVPCRRCGGTGMFGPRSVEGGRCFSCLGEGVVVKPGKAEKAWVAFRKALPGKTCCAEDVQVGDRVVRGLRKEAGVPWLTVTGKAFSIEWTGSCLIGTDESKRIHYGTVYLTLSDGTTMRLSERQGVRRFVTEAMIPNPRDYWPAA